ncbi:GNAT family N-acetyltransferase [uncultured Gemmiger sp.]|uniref:GNAT family N-acetyltransferase n=1 Tax=uncultured Gemmiger sp. TaxID=1623490 RepID=UPI0025DFF4E8|nr:GNAT family N-acetyltransferase [uncultured Gemmiger sp.]
MDQITLYVPKLEDLWFRQKLQADPATMSYNAGWNVDFPGYHRDTGCVDFPQSGWAAWHAAWVNREPKRFFAYIRRDSDQAWLGEVNFHYVPADDWWDMGIVLLAACRGKGYSRPALQLLLDHAFRDCGVTRIHNDFEPSRQSARKLHRDAGFREMGLDREGLLHLLLTRQEYLAANRPKH